MLLNSRKHRIVRYMPCFYSVSSTMNPAEGRAKFLRAGPLSSPKIINLLNMPFVNVWVLLRDLPELQAGAKGAAAAAFATKLRHHYTDSVDILTLTPELEVIEHLPGESLLRSDYLPRTERYLDI